MSIEICRCGKFIDTDEDDQAYLVYDQDHQPITLGYALCPICRDEFPDILALIKKTEQFTQDVYDWVRTAKQVSLLDDLYEFKRKLVALTSTTKEEKNV